jgi:hypothetical protein
VVAVQERAVAVQERAVAIQERAVAIQEQAVAVQEQAVAVQEQAAAIQERVAWVTVVAVTRCLARRVAKPRSEWRGARSRCWLCSCAVDRGTNAAHVNLDAGVHASCGASPHALRKSECRIKGPA